MRLDRDDLAPTTKLEFVGDIFGTSNTALDLDFARGSGLQNDL
jgi:hypothetical protein